MSHYWFRDPPIFEHFHISHFLQKKTSVCSIFGLINFLQSKTYKPFTQQKCFSVQLIVLVLLSTEYLRGFFWSLIFPRKVANHKLALTKVSEIFCAIISSLMSGNVSLHQMASKGSISKKVPKTLFHIEASITTSEITIAVVEIEDVGYLYQYLYPYFYLYLYLYLYLLRLRMLVRRNDK